MSIAPVKGYPPLGSEQSESGSSANAKVRSGSPQAQPKSDVEEEAAQPVSGAPPKQEKTVAKKVSASYELPEDVVEVHQDPEAKGQIIIQYLDPARNVILQVPSTEELNVERGIAKGTQEAAKQRDSESTAAAGSVGGKTHGD